MGEPVAGERRERVDQLLPQAGQLLAAGPGLGQPGRPGAVRVADELEQHLRPHDLHGVRHRHLRVVELAQRGELGVRPLARDRLLAERGPVGGRAAHPAVPGTPAFEVPGVPVEQPVVRVAVPLRGKQAGPLRAWHGTPEQIDVGFLAGLQDAELGVDRGELGDQPLRMRQRAALGGRGLIPGGPAITFGQAVGRVVRVLGDEPLQMPVALGEGLFVVEMLPLPLTRAADPAIRGVVRICAVAHWWCSSGGLRSGQAE